MNIPDTFNLQRFLDAQENDYADALHKIKPLSLRKNTQLNATKVLKHLHISKKYSTFAIVLNKLAL